MCVGQKSLSAFLNVEWLSDILGGDQGIYRNQITEVKGLKTFILKNLCWDQWGKVTISSSHSSITFTTLLH